MALRWGIASSGKISHDFVCALQTFPNEEHQIVAIGSRYKITAIQFAESHNIPKAYEGLDKLAEDDEVDIVYIGLSNEFHLSVAKKMLDGGKHVLCEKPMTLCAEEAKELISYAKVKKLFLMEAMWSRCFPVYEELKRRIDVGEIGQVKQVNIDLGFALGNDQINVKELENSTVLDLGIHVLQFSQYIFRDQRPVKLVSLGHMNNHGVHDCSGAVIVYPNGKLSVLSINGKVELSNTAYIYGTKGMIKVPLFWCPSTLITPNENIIYDLPASTTTFNYLNSSGLAYEAEEARNCIRLGLIESPKMTHAESLELAEHMDVIRNNSIIIW